MVAVALTRRLDRRERAEQDRLACCRWLRRGAASQCESRKVTHRQQMHHILWDRSKGTAAVPAATKAVPGLCNAHEPISAMHAAEITQWTCDATAKHRNIQERTCRAYVGSLVNSVDMMISRLDGKPLTQDDFWCNSSQLRASLHEKLLCPSGCHENEPSWPSICCCLEEIAQPQNIRERITMASVSLMVCRTAAHRQRSR